MVELTNSSMVTNRGDRSVRIADIIKRQGVSVLLSKTYNDSQDISVGLYNGEGYGFEIGNEVPIVYGEIMLIGKIISAGEIRSDIDPSEVQKVIRVSMGEGPVEGIKGVDAEKLQSIYIDCTQVVDSETGKANKYNIGLKEIAGGALGLGLLFSNSIANIFKKDPVTGNEIESVNAQVADADTVIAAGDDGQISTGDDMILKYGPDQNKIIQVSLSELINNAITLKISNATANATGGGSGGSGQAGNAGTSGTNAVVTVETSAESSNAAISAISNAIASPNSNATIVSENITTDINNYGKTEYEPPEPLDCGPKPQILSQSVTYTPPPAVAKTNEKLLIHQGDTNRYWIEPIDLYRKTWVKFHFNFARLFLEKTVNWSISNGGGSGTVSQKESGTVKIRWCVHEPTTDEIIDEGGVWVQDGESEYAFTKSFQVDVSSIALAIKKSTSCDPYAKSPLLVNFRFYRVDEGTSSTDVYYQGPSWQQSPANSGTPYTSPLSTVSPPENTPAKLTKIADDGAAPNQTPRGAFGSAMCPVYNNSNSGVTVTVEGGKGGTGGSGGKGGDAGALGNVVIDISNAIITASPKNGPDANAPTLTYTTPRDAQYDTTVANAVATLPVFTANTKSSNSSVTVVFTMTQGQGTLSSNVTSAPASISWDGGAKTLTVAGPVTNVNTILGALRYTPNTNEKGDIVYTAKITDADAKVFNVSGNFKVFDKAVAHDAKAASQIFKLIGNAGTTTILVNGNAISNAVAYNTSIDQTVKDLITSINDTKTTPNYTAVYVSNATMKVNAPAGLGYDANGWKITLSTTGNIQIVDPTSNTVTEPSLDGGVTSNKEKVSTGTKLLNGFLKIAPALGAGVLSYTIMSSLGQSEISVAANTVTNNSTVSVIMRGKKVKVPNNYDPVNRTFSGAWDYETFSANVAYTDNPVWCWLDYVENKRYGCGDSIKLTADQRTQLYKDCYNAAVRCDSVVWTGRTNVDETADGISDIDQSNTIAVAQATYNAITSATKTYEKRYSLNTAIAKTTRIDALNNLAANFHARPLFTVDGLRLIQDRPTLPIRVVTNGNTFEDDGIKYSGGSQDASYNYAKITWNDPDKFYKLMTTLIYNSEDVKSFGERPVETMAYGCTSEGQARRHGAWLLQNEQTNPLTISYAAGHDHDGLIAGDIVILVNNDEEVDNVGGRVIQKNSNTVYVMDRPIPSGSTIWWNDNDGALQHSNAFTVVGNTVTFSTSTDIEVTAVYCATMDGEAKANQWKILSINETDVGKFAVTAVNHDPDKYTRIDNLEI